MAEKKSPPKTPFVDKVVEDPKAPPDALVLSGFLGRSSESGHTRLYLDPQLSDCVEIPDDAILHSQEIPPEASPLGGSYVWIQRDAELIHPGPEGTSSKGTFLEGRIRKAYGRGVQPGAGPIPTLPTGCGPLSLCPPTCIPVVCQQECETKPDRPEIPTVPITQCGDGTVCPPTCIPILCDDLPEDHKPEQFPTFPLTRCGPGTACPPTCLPGLCGEQHPPCPTLIQTCATAPPFFGGGFAQQAGHLAGGAVAAAAGGLGGFGGGGIFDQTAAACNLPPDRTHFGFPTCDSFCPTRFGCTRIFTECGPPSVCQLCPTDICPTRANCPSHPFVICQVASVAAPCELQATPLAAQAAPQAQAVTAGSPICEPTVLGLRSHCAPCVSWIYPHCPVETLIGPHSQCPPTCVGPWCQAPTYDLHDCAVSRPFGCPTGIRCGTLLECGGWGQPATPVLGGGVAAQQAPMLGQAGAGYAAAGPYQGAIDVAAHQAGQRYITQQQCYWQTLPAWTICGCPSAPGPCQAPPTRYGPHTICPPCVTESGCTRGLECVTRPGLHTCPPCRTLEGPFTACPPTCGPPFC